MWDALLGNFQIFLDVLLHRVLRPSHLVPLSHQHLHVEVYQTQKCCWQPNWRETIKTIKWNEQLIKASWPTYCRQFQLVVIHSSLETLKWVELNESRVKMTVEQMTEVKVRIRKKFNNYRLTWVSSRVENGVNYEYAASSAVDSSIHSALSAWWKCELLKS